MRIFLATPASPPVCTLNYVEALLPLVFTLRDAKIEMEASWLGNQSGIGHARNKLAGWFLESKADKLLFIDADIGVPAHAVLAMIAADVELVGALCPKKTIDWEAVYRFARDAPTEVLTPGRLERASRRVAVLGETGDREVRNGVPLMRVQAVGAGCMLIDRRAFERFYSEELAAPYIDRSETGEGKSYRNFFEAGPDWREGAENSGSTDDLEYVSEDYSFCRRLRDLGGEVFALPPPAAPAGMPLEAPGLAGRFTHAGFHTFGG